METRHCLPNYCNMFTSVHNNLQASNGSGINCKSVSSATAAITMYARDNYWARWSRPRPRSSSSASSASNRNWRQQDCKLSAEGEGGGGGALKESDCYSWRQCLKPRPSTPSSAPMNGADGERDSQSPSVRHTKSSNSSRAIDTLSKAQPNCTTPTNVTYASIVKKPVDVVVEQQQTSKPSVEECTEKTKLIENGLRKKMQVGLGLHVLPVHCHYIRLDTSPNVATSTRKADLNSPKESPAKPEASLNKLDYLRQLLSGGGGGGTGTGGKGSGQPSSSENKQQSNCSVFGDNNIPTVGMHLVNGKGRPVPSADRHDDEHTDSSAGGCNNSLVAFIMGFGTIGDESDDDDDDDDEEDDETDNGDWNNCGPIMKIPDMADNRTETGSPSVVVDVFYPDFGELELAEANARWRRAYSGVVIRNPATTTSNKKVSFADGSQLETVHSTSPECRKSPWEEAARDRHRFQRRIHETGFLLDGILEADHRHRVYTNQILPYQ